MIHATTLLLVLTAAICLPAVDSFLQRVAHHYSQASNNNRPSRLGWNRHSHGDIDSDCSDSNHRWNRVGTDDTASTTAMAEGEDWETILKRKQDGSFWSDFESSSDSSDSDSTVVPDDADTKLDALFAVQAEEMAFTAREAKRADTARQMQEWGFVASTIAAALNVAVEESPDEVEGMQNYREASYLESDDLTTIESHTRVPKDPNTNEPIRSQMVYVDEHACIGCTR
jgi:hypothetical protein